MASFTPTQGRYLAFIHAYTSLRGFPPSEAEIAAAMVVSAPSVSNMVKTLEKKGLIRREPLVSRAIEILVPAEEIPAWNARKTSPSKPTAGRVRSAPQKMWQPRESKAPDQDSSTPANLYVLTAYLTNVPATTKLAKKSISRTVEIRGDQTLEDLHDVLFKAFDRWDPHLYEFQFGKRPFDPKGIRYGTQSKRSRLLRDARTTRMDDLELKPEQVFGYWFDFGEDWYHQIRVERVEQAIPTARYPRVIHRMGESPPQY
jgi:hypothetical protein